jgi:hypothetical protein
MPVLGFLRRVPWRGVVALALVLVAIGGAEGSTSAQAGQRPDVSAVLLRAEDLPDGWTPVDFSDLGGDPLGLGDVGSLEMENLGLDPTGPCAAALAPFIDLLIANPPAVDMALFQRGTFGPFIGHIVIVPPPGLIDALTDVFEDPTTFEASESCQQELDETSGDALPFDLTDFSLSVETTPLDLPPLGEESIAFRMDVTRGFIGT